MVILKFIILSALIITIQPRIVKKDITPQLTRDFTDLMKVNNKQESSPRRSNATLNLSRGNNFRIIQIPKRYFEKSRLIVEVECTNESIFATEIVVSTLSQKNAIAYRKFIHCDSFSSNIFHVSLKLPRYIAYKPSHLNRYSVYVDSATLRCWILSTNSYDVIGGNKQADYYKSSTIKFESTIKIADPYDRPTRPLDKCYDWLKLQLLNLPYAPKCNIESEVVKAVTFPVALSGLHTGIHRVYVPYKNVNLRAQQLEAFTRPVFSFVIWLYVEEYCPFQKPHCSILQHITWDDRYATPQISISNEGRVSVELIMEDGTGVFHLSSVDQIVPKHTWSMLVLACLPTHCNLSVSHGSPLKLHWLKKLSVDDDQTLYYDDTMGMIVYGGSELSSSFKGYIGKVTYYRRRSVLPDEFEQLSSDKDTSVKLRLNERHLKCSRFTEHIYRLMERRKCINDRSMRKVTCPAKHENPLLFTCTIPQAYLVKACNQVKLKGFSLYKHVYDLVKDYARLGRYDNYEGIAQEIYYEAEELLDDEGVKGMESIISLLKQSSCLGNHDATFMLSVILNYGVTVRSKDVEPHSYLMYGALDGNRLCLLSLGNKHVYSLDGFTHDYEQAYVYFKPVADMTNKDLRVHKTDDLYTEMVRLTNDVEVKEQTEEDGDIIYYLKMQADQGVLLAQKRLARMYYWGSGGLPRNIRAAHKYYKMAASSGDPSSLYDYAIVLLKGHGTQKNVTSAIELLKMSADLGYSQAMNSLGWVAMEMEENYTSAAEYFHRSHGLGNKDASYNLAHMFLKGKYPNSSVDRVRAWEFLAAGALRGQFEAGILVGKYNMRGHPRIRRNPELAVGWVRYVAERNPGIGRLLHKGLKSYKEMNWFSALVYYLMSASTGVEVANFNLAYLCDEDNGGYVKFLDKECKWRHYNLSTQRAPKDVDPYAWNKMAQYYYYYGINGLNDTKEAVRFYFNAAIRDDPQGLYNLAMLVEEGVDVSAHYLDSLLVPLEFHSDKFQLTAHLLIRCRDLKHSEAYLPCTFAFYRLMLQHTFKSIVNLIGPHLMLFIAILMAIAISSLL